MLRLLGRRVRVQWPLLAALLAVVSVGATLLGTCALLTTSTAEKALVVAASRAAPADVDVTAYTVEIRGPDARSVAADTRDLLASALAPFTATTAARASSVLRSLGDGADAYLSGMDDLPARARLTAGRWPGAPREAVVLEPTARQLGLTVGSTVHLGPELSIDPAPALDVTVVGIVYALPDTGWDRDPLGGAGYDLAYGDGRAAGPVHAYGPFIVDLADLLAGASNLDRLEITAHPDLAHPTVRDLDTVARATRAADRQLARTLGGRVRIERIATRLPQTLRSDRDQQQVTAATVLALAALGVLLAATALALAGRLTASVRADETALLTALGVSRAQFAGAAAIEAGALAILAAALAVPASSALGGLIVTVTQVLAVTAGALALAVVLVIAAVRPAPGNRTVLARSGADLLLVAFAAAGWWQLRAQPTAAGTRADAVRVVAPALLLVAGAALALRLVPPALRAADRLARRGRGLVLPLAAFEAARRPQAVAAGLLIGLACAASTFGVAFDATWQRSQHDQADLAVGTDLAVTLAVPPTAGQGAAVGAATGGAVSPAADRGIAVGQWLGSAGDAPRLVAVDTTRAEALLRGRLDQGRGWADIGAALAPKTRATGIAVPMGATLTLTGAAPIVVTPRLVLEDPTGLRIPCTGLPVVLDGSPHPLSGCATAEGLRLVAVSLRFGDEPPDRHVAATLTVPGTHAGAWTAISPDSTVSFTGTQLQMETTLRAGRPPELIATAFPAPGPIPVAISARLAGEVGANRGSLLSLTVATTSVPATVTEVLPTVPSAPGASAVLADFDALSRALIVSGNLEPAVDAYWIGHPTRADAALHLGAVTTRTAEAARRGSGPLRAGLPAALHLLVIAAALLLLAGVVLHVTCDLRVRALEVARLRGLGMSRREIRTMLLGQHAGVMMPLLVVGAAVGAVATRLVAPLLVRSDTGAAPVPSPLPSWPWATEAAVFAGLVVGCLIALTAAVTVQSRQADAAHLRVTS